jgi:hypothetical protein
MIETAFAMNPFKYSTELSTKGFKSVIEYKFIKKLDVLTTRTTILFINYDHFSINACLYGHDEISHSKEIFISIILLTYHIS